MKKIIIPFIVYILISIFGSTNTYANYNGLFANMTLRDLNSNIEKLNQEKSQFLNITNSQKKEYGELINFIKTNLTRNEFEDIRKVVENYIWEKDKKERDLKNMIKENKNTTKQKDLILRTQANFYKDIARFVDLEKRDDFIKHIRFNIETNRDKKNIIENIIKSENELESRIDLLQGKVKKHHANLSDNLDIVIKENVKTRIDNIVNNERYLLLNNDIKNNIYKNFIQDLEERLNSLDGNNLNSNYIMIRSKILETMIEEFKNIVK